MPAKFQTLSNALLNAVLTNVAFSSPVAVYSALYTTAPTATSAGTEVTTAGGTLYARTAVTFGAASAGVSQNSAPCTFPIAGTAWGTVTAVAVCSTNTAGDSNLLYFGNLTTPKTVGSGDQVSFATSALSVTEQ